mmetsp:Transcript_9625/g.23259  ORF Transcript_9625/g.23259 Transcript_9625/m.23259 type:complete len:211 (-) Transcript_9625:103-735(-)
MKKRSALLWLLPRLELSHDYGGLLALASAAPDSFHPSSSPQASPQPSPSSSCPQPLPWLVASCVVEGTPRCDCDDGVGTENEAGTRLPGVARVEGGIGWLAIGVEGAWGENSPSSSVHSQLMVAAAIDVSVAGVTPPPPLRKPGPVAATPRVLARTTSLDWEPRGEGEVMREALNSCSSSSGASHRPRMSTRSSGKRRTRAIHTARGRRK